MLQMKKTEHQTRLFNMDRFIALWSVDKEKAREYQRDCEAYWQEYCLQQQSGQTVEKANDDKPVIEEKELTKEEMVKLLKDNWMKLANMKWSEETLKKHVANIKK